MRGVHVVQAQAALSHRPTDTHVWTWLYNHGYTGIQRNSIAWLQRLLRGY